MFTDYSDFPVMGEVADIGKINWGKIWKVAKSIASTLFPGPYSIAAGVVSLFDRGVNGIGALSADEKEMIIYKNLLKNLSPEQRAQLNKAVASQLQITVKEVEDSNVAVATVAPDAKESKTPWLLIGATLGVGYLLFSKRSS